jgi:hypothetical protein
MARRGGRRVGSPEPQSEPETGPATSTPASPSGLVQFNPTASQAPVAGPLTAQNNVDPIGTLKPSADVLAAKAELKARMGNLLEGVGQAQALALNADVGQSNIVGWAVGEKVAGASYTGIMAVRALVMQKVSRSRLTRATLVPDQVAGVPTDVEEVGEITARSYTGRYRPAPGGSSVGHPGITAGTLGCLVVLVSGKLCLLSNNHVLANANEATRGDPILQPGPADGGLHPRDQIGVLEDFVPLRFDGDNAVDAAVALTSFTLAAPTFQGGFRLGLTPVEGAVHLTVRKVGRTTDGTLGDIVGLSADIRVRYGTRFALFTDQLQIRGRNEVFSRGGDSGALILSAGSFQPVGLLFAGGNLDTFANPITAVIRALGISRFLAVRE